MGFKRLAFILLFISSRAFGWAGSVLVPTATPRATDTPAFTATLVPTDTPRATDTPIPAPTSRPTDTPIPAPTVITTMTGYVPYTGANADVNLGLNAISATTGTLGTTSTGGDFACYATQVEKMPALTTGNWTGVDGTIITYGTSPNVIQKVADGTGTVDSIGAAAVSGSVYKVVLVCTVTSGSFIAHYGGKNILQAGSTTISSTGTYSFYMTANAANQMEFQCSVSTARWVINSISAKLITAGKVRAEGLFEADSPLVDSNGNKIFYFENSQVLLGQDGSNASPGVAFSSQPGMGMFRLSSTKLGFVTTNQQCVFVYSGGASHALGFGSNTGTPLAFIHFLSDSNTSAQGIAYGLTSPVYTYKGATDFLYGTGGFLSLTATAGIGYGLGSGGIVTQATSKATGVTLNTVNGQITMNNAALASGATVAFTFTNSRIGAFDTIIVNHASGGTADAYDPNVGAVAAGSCHIHVRNNTAGSLSEAIVLTFSVIKGNNQ